MASARLVLLAALVSTGILACNEHPLSPLGDTLAVTTVEVSERLRSNDVDILWVVDSSPSMREEQAELGARFNEFVTALSELEANFRMAVVTTDLLTNPARAGQFRTGPGFVTSLGCVEPPVELEYCEDLALEQPFLLASDYYLDDFDPSIGLDTTALARDFRCIASAGDCGGSFEMGLEALRASLNRETLAGVNENFLRDEAFLLVIFLTDEDDCSNNGSFTLTRDADCYAAERRGDMVPVQEYYDFLVDIKGGQEEKVLIAGLIGPTDGLPPQTFQQLEDDGVRFSCNSALGGAEGGTASARDGERYRELIEFVGSRGIEESICQGNFATALTNIGEILRAALDVNCLNKEPRTCLDDIDCGGDLRCVDPGQVGEGARYCSNFEVVVEIEAAEGEEFQELVSPGPAGDYVGTVQPPGDAEFVVNYDASVCLYGVAFSFAPGSRPATGSRYRVSYPRSTDVISATDSEETE